MAKLKPEHQREFRRMYRWRTLNEHQQHELLEFGKFNRRPWHSPSHVEGLNGRYMLTAACYEHQSIIGRSPERLVDFSERLLSVLSGHCEQIYAWCVLPNHYHALVLTRTLPELLHGIGQLRGRTSFEWNGEDGQRGRKVWFNCAETGMKSDRHFWATLNYIHHNPVHHGYVREWHGWPFSSGGSFVEQLGREQAAELWREYPVTDYGKSWDPPEL